MPLHSAPSAIAQSFGRCPGRCVNVGKLDRFGNPIPLQATAESNQMTDTEVEILTLEEVAAYLKAGKRMAYCLAQKGGIQAFKVDREDRR